MSLLLYPQPQPAGRGACFHQPAEQSTYTEPVRQSPGESASEPRQRHGSPHPVGPVQQPADWPAAVSGPPAPPAQSPPEAQQAADTASR